jgi:hypothetical protein
LQTLQYNGIPPLAPFSSLNPAECGKFLWKNASRGVIAAPLGIDSLIESI